ncbi:MAG: chemotaxis protein CheW [Euryarchaeota archaeon]|nr:chemotaxis protein CheW [Euryarchaeota archaeon]
MDDMSEYQKLYAIESAEHLQSMNSALLCLEKDTHDDETINVMFRAAHTLKGMSATMGYINISELTHKMENLMDRVRKKEMNLDADAIDILFECLDTLEIMVETPENSTQCDISKLIANLLSITNKGGCSGSTQKQPEAPQKNPVENSTNSKKSVTGSKIYNIKVTIDNSCTLLSARSNVIMRDLSEIGDIVEAILPSGEGVKTSREIRINISTNADAKKIESILKNILEVSSVEVKQEVDHSTEKQPDVAKPVETQHEEAQSTKKQPEVAQSTEKQQETPAMQNDPDIIDDAVENTGTGNNVFNVTVTLERSCTLKVARATIIMRDLSEIGEIIEISPPTGDIWAGKFLQELRIKVSTKEDAKEIESVLKKILDVSAVEVKPEVAKSVEKPPAAPEPQNAAGIIDNAVEKAGTDGNIFNVTINLDKSCTLKIPRATIIMRNLSEIGEIIETSPSASDIKVGKFLQELKIKVSTRKEAKEIESILMKILEVASVEVKREVTQKAETRPEPAQAAGRTVLNKEKIIEKEKAAGKNIQTVRVSVERLDSLMNLVGELVINKIRIVQLASDYKIDALEEALSSLDNLTGQLQEGIMASRMVPLEQIFNRFPRMIRDLAKIEHKKIELIITGSDIELDRTILDEIGDPLVHILRNCVDHGIELPEIRKQLGKNQAGSIKLTARREKNYVTIEVEDDGKGMDPETFREIAVKKGLLAKEDASKLSDVEALNLSYLPGFTSTEKVTEISGRGVGLDVVRSKIQSMGGSVKLESKYGAGTKISLKLPLTVAIINSQMVRVGKNVYAIPIANVVRDIAINKDQIKTIQSEEVVMVRGEVLPLIRLQNLFGGSCNGSKEMVVVVVERMGSNVGLVVDQLIGQQEVIIKNIDNRFLKGLKGFAGATILGDGNVALIIDVGTLL